jgi:hypothetical protein
VLFDRLSAVEQHALQALSADPESYGILRPRENHRLSMKAVTRDTALLLFTLQTPQVLPRYAVAALGDQCESVIGQMVMDGILEIEVNGEMLSGPAAHAIIFSERASPASVNSLAALSRKALEYAEALEVVDRSALSARLYMYNRIPASPRWRRLLPDATAVESHLGIQNGAAAQLQEAGWVRAAHYAGASWTAWNSPRMTHGRNKTATYKLYVSPACSELRAAFAATAEGVARSAALHLKVGNDLYGLLRPDKIVVYFSEFADLQATAADLLEKFGGCPAHGVPFTAEIAAQGLLSWGIDPPTEEHSVPWLERESWRGRICNRLGTALALAKSSGETGVAPARFAIERLRIEGIDTDTWTPTKMLNWAAPADG